MHIHIDHIWITVFILFVYSSQLRTYSYLQWQPTGKQWVNCLIQEQNYRFLPCQLWDSIQQPFGYCPNALIPRLPATAHGQNWHGMCATLTMWTQMARGSLSRGYWYGHRHSRYWWIFPYVLLLTVSHSKWVFWGQRSSQNGCVLWTQHGIVQHPIYDPTWKPLLTIDVKQNITVGYWGLYLKIILPAYLSKLGSYTLLYMNIACSLKAQCS